MITNFLVYIFILKFFKYILMSVSFIPQRVACLLRKVVQEIERRISTQAEHLRTVVCQKILLLLFCIEFFSLITWLLFYVQQNNLYKAREEKYQSRIKVLEALATGTSEETQVVSKTLMWSFSQRFAFMCASNMNPIHQMIKSYLQIVMNKLQQIKV